MKKLTQFGAIALLAFCAQATVLTAQTATNATPSGQVAPPTTTTAPSTTSTPTSSPKPTSKPATKPATTTTTAPVQADQTTLAPIVVTASAPPESQQAAINNQHDSNIFVNSISKERIDDTTAKSIGEAVQKLPGVSINNQRGEPQFIQIRGAAQDLNSLSFDGVRLMTNDNGKGRAVEVNVLPAGIVGRIDVSKTTSPDLDSEGIGGSINLIPKSAFDYSGEHQEYQVLYGDAPLHGYNPIYKGSAQYSNIWKVAPDVTLGMLATGGYYENNQPIDDLEYTYDFKNPADQADKLVTDFSERRYNWQRRRGNAGMNLDLNVGNDAHYYAHFFYSGYDERRRRYDSDIILPSGGPNPATVGYTFNPDGSTTFTPSPGKSASITEDSTDYLEKDRNFALVVGGDNKLNDDISVDYKGSFADATTVQPYIYVSTFKNSTPGAITYTNSGASTSPGISLQPGVYNPSNFIFSKQTNKPFVFEDAEYGAQQNIKIKAPIEDNPGELKFGLSERIRSNALTNDQTTLNSTAQQLNLTQVDQENAITYYGGPNYSIGNPVDVNTIQSILNNNPQYAVQSATQAAKDKAAAKGGSYDASENVLAVYGMYTLHVDQLTILTGVRVEGTTDAYTYYNVTNGNSYSQAQGANEYVNALPCLQLKYEVSPQIVTRAGYSKSLARPTFGQFIPSQNYSPGSGAGSSNGTLTLGNPNLKPIRSHNFDIDAEYYPMDGTLLTAGLFDKEISDYAFATSFTEADPFQPGATVTATSTSAINHSRIFGVDAAFEHQMTYLPGFLGGIGFYGNMTYDRSSGQDHPGQINQALPGQSPFVANFGAFYKHGPWSSNIGANYQRHFLNKVHTDGTPDEFKDNYLQLAAKIQYAIDDNFTVFVEGMNLNDNHLRYYQGDPNHPIQDEFYRPSFDAGFKVKY